MKRLLSNAQRKQKARKRVTQLGKRAERLAISRIIPTSRRNNKTKFHLDIDEAFQLKPLSKVAAGDDQPKVETFQDEASVNLQPLAQTQLKEESEKTDGITTVESESSVS